MYYLNLAQDHTGLSNQIFALFSTIIHCYLNKIPIIIVDKFLTEIYSKNYMPISKVLNLKKLNDFLKNYKVTVVDSKYQNFKIKNVIFGVENNYLDITEKFRFYFEEDKKIFLKQDTNLVKLFSDPAPFKEKHIKIILEPFYEIIIKEKNETVINDFMIDLNNVIKETNYVMSPIWQILQENQNISNNLFQNLPLFLDDFFHDTKEKELEHFFKENKNRKINTIHLRLEDDAIQHWSKLQNLSQSDFKNQLSSIYIDLVKKNFEKSDIIILLSYCKNNDVIDYLKENGYDFYIKENLKFKNREINAIIDFLIGQTCNNIFIGAGGSTFTDLIAGSIKNKKSFFININNLNQPILETGETIEFLSNTEMKLF
jgi:hypothetical protein